MSATAGAPPPPPPPPPPPGKDFEDLPAELLLGVIEYLKAEDYVQLALAIYPILRRHGLVPPLTNDIYQQIANHQPPPPGNAVFRWPLPVELTEEIMRYLDPADTIALLFANRELIMRYLPQLTKETKMRLWNSMEKK